MCRGFKFSFFFVWGSFKVVEIGRWEESVVWDRVFCGLLIKF